MRIASEETSSALPDLPLKGRADEKRPFAFRLPRGMHREMVEIAKGRGIRISDVALEFCRFGLEAWRAGSGGVKK